uniref:ATP synthase F0 subunit 8 n=1 Tax=Penthetria simplicipes TaxID=3097416 RepID=UPI002E7638AB|nr:ATP synthase F0 subunit 8 [Penthetria simplicipes]WPM86378.1 ATP synthase F0 subunit 8 [Penthetria simplicipes]
MPQMSPMNWMFLFIFFFIIFLMFNMLNYFSFFQPKMFLNKNTFLKNSLNWKW